MFFPNKHLLIHIPKTGGSSLEHAIVSSYLEAVNDSQLEDLAYEQFSVHGHFGHKVKGQGGHTLALFRNMTNF